MLMLSFLKLPFTWFGKLSHFEVLACLCCDETAQVT